MSRRARRHPSDSVPRAPRESPAAGVPSDARTAPDRRRSRHRCRVHPGPRGGSRRVRAPGTAPAATRHAAGICVPAMPSSAWQYAQENATAESPDTRAARRWPSRMGSSREAPLDALVHITEALLEPQYLLADDRESKVPRLDDAGVHGTDRNLVHALALDAHEFIGVHVRLSGRRQRLRIDRAADSFAAMPRGAARGAYPDRSKRNPERSASARCMRAAAGKRSSSPGYGACGSATGRLNTRPLFSARNAARTDGRGTLVLARPERHESAACRRPSPAPPGAIPRARRSERAARGRPAGRRSERTRLAAPSHPPPIRRAAARYQSARYGGM